MEDGHRLDQVIDPEQKEQLLEEIELLDGASAEFDQEQVDKGALISGVFRFRPYQLRRGDLFEAFPENDFFSPAKNV